MSEETFIAPQPEQLSELLPAFDFQSFIAQGGMGAVYKARQKSLDRDVAIKILPREFGNDPEFRASFETEAKAMAKLNHPNLIGVYDFGSIDGMPYIVMEYVDGSSLYHSAWGKVIAPEQAVALVKAICEGLGHAHENGVLHRDIKPANILLTPKAEPKIGDFGLAQSVDGGGGGLVMGTPGYSAPEFLNDHASADHRADIYAVGVILHELITGQRPDPAYQEPFEASKDPGLDAIWKKATEPDPARRYATATEMADDLGKWSASPASRLVTGGGAAAGRPASPPTTRTTGVLAPPRSPQSSGAKAAAGAPVPRRPAPAPTTATGGGNLVRNLFIIAGLLVAIAFTWKSLQEEKVDRVVENQQIENENKQAKEAQLAAQKALAEERKKQAAAKPPAPVVPEVPANETLEGSLARLKGSLVAGSRAQMPKSSERHGSSDYLVMVDRPMSWHDASAYAEEHGGHLATVASQADFNWLAQFLPEGVSAWLGAGRSDGGGWIQVDGTAWPLTQKPTGVGEFASLDKLGITRARPEDSELPFVIQWRRDSSNPGSLASMLDRAGSTLNDTAPVFPPGTKSQDARRFCVIERPVTRDEAASLADRAGGFLASPSTRDEQIWLQETFKGLTAPNGLWLGGKKDGLGWIWLSGEEWDATGWCDRALPDLGKTAMVFMPGEGWLDMDPSKVVDGFIIEWSSDGGSGVDGMFGEISDLGEAALENPDVKELRARAVDLVSKEADEYEKNLKANRDKLVWDLNVLIRGLNTTEAGRWKRHGETLVEILEEADEPQIPTSTELAKNKELLLSQEMRKNLEFYRDKEKEVTAKHLAQLKSIRNAYARRLEGISKELAAKGDEEITSSIARLIKHSEKVEAWAAGLSD